MSTKMKRGLASLGPEKRKEIASTGGKAAHASGKAHQWTSEQARAAALKGQASRKAKKEAEASKPKVFDVSGKA